MKIKLLIKTCNQSTDIQITSQPIPPVSQSSVGIKQFKIAYSGMISLREFQTGLERPFLPRFSL